MAMSKHQLSDSLSRKRFTLERQLKLFDSYKKRKQICRQVAEQIDIGKIAAAPSKI